MENKSEKPDLSSLRIDKSKRVSDRPRSKIWRYLLIAVLAVVIVGAYLWFKKDITPATKVKVATVRIIGGSEAEAALVATGYVVAQRKAEVASKATGRLEYLGLEEGDIVKSGEVIARIDNEDIKAALDLAKANLLYAEADSLNAGRNFRRQTNLFESGSIRETELESAETAYKLSLASIAAAEASVKAAEVNLENTYIRAPFDGTVLTKNADVGEVVAPFASSASSKGSVVTLADMGSLEVEADVSEANIQKVSTGQRCEIVLDAYPETRYPGYVKKIVPTADRARATVMTKIAFVSIDRRVLPEMSARVNLFPAGSERQNTNTSPTTVSVPNEAITTRDGQKIVFRIEGDLVIAVNVEVGRELGSMTEILNGVAAGDRVVLSPPGKMASGDKVEISN